MSGGLGLSDFLNHNKDSGSQKWLKNWKDDGSIIVWIHTRAAMAYPSWNHPFIMNGTFTDKKTNEERECLRYPKFVSPDPEIVHQHQYFRFREQDNGPLGHMKTPPVLDPFLRLREWLRLECELPLDTIVFRWVNPNPKRGEDPIREWTRGQLAKLVDKTNTTYGHSLDTKLEYLFVVVDDSAPGDGAQIVRCPKLLGDCMKAAIGQEMESNGDDGNPLINPFAFKWVYDKSQASPMNYYKAYRYNQARLTDAVREAITSAEHPDPTSQTKWQPGDKAKIRAAMADAARIDLPWDRLFVDAWIDKEPEGGRGTDFNFGANKPPEDKPNGAETKTETAETPPPASSSGGGPKTRRRKKKDKPAPPPEPERIKCDECPEMLLPTDTKCPACGTEYEIEEADDPPSGSSSSGASTSSPGGGTGSSPASSGTSKGADKCWSCGNATIVDNKCSNCGIDISDDIPFG